MLDNVWGPTGTVLLHILIVLVLVKFMTGTGRHVEHEVEVVIREIESFEELEDLEEELDELDDIPTVVETVAPPTVSLDQEPPQVDSITPSAADEVDLSQFDVMEAVSPLKFRGLYASRSAGGRSAALGKYSGGMGERTEYAVKKALEWLKDHQEPGGSWGPSYRVSMTGLALLTFFAHGDTTASEEYGLAIKKGLQFLLKSQKGGKFVGGGDGVQAQIQSYEHVIGTYAMSEAYGLTRIPFLRHSMEDAVQLLIDGQHEAGSWDYGYRQGPEAHIDVSLSGWHIQALKAAVAADASNRGLKTALENGVRGLKAACDMSGTGMFEYGTRAAHKPDNIMTGVGVLSMQLAGHALDAEARAGIQALTSLRFRWSPGAADERAVGKWPLYAWYYITQARFHQGGKSWVTWNKDYAASLCAMQNSDGSWCPPPSTDEARYGPVYATTLCTLMLQVYYRFLPTFQAIEVEKLAPELEIEEDDLVIEFS